MCVKNIVLLWDVGNCGVVISLLVLLDDGEDLLHVLPAPEEDGAALVQLGGPENKNKRDGIFFT